MQVTAVKAHLALSVRNVEQSIAFYTKLFGIAPFKVRTGYAKFDVHNPPLNFTLNQLPAAVASTGAHAAHSSPGLNHLGIQVASSEEVMQLRAEWVAAGLPVRDEMQTTCCYALQDKSWVSDPDGNEWEVFVVLQDHLPEHSNAIDNKQPCCTPAPSVNAACCTTTDDSPCCVGDTK